MTRRIAPRGAPLAERLRMYSRVEDGCVVWTGGRDKNGYGKIEIGGKTRRVIRVVWELANGQIPPGQLIRHSCDNPPCIELTHLIAGSPGKNSEDRVHRDRFNHQSPRYNRVKLNMQLAREIRHRFAAGERAAELAKEFGVGKEQIYRVTTNICWKERS